MSPNTGEWTREEVIEIAKRQKFLLWMILLQIVAVFLMPSIGEEFVSVAHAVAAVCVVLMRLGIAILSAYGIYKMARSLRKDLALAYVLAQILPLIGLLMLLLLNSQANRVMRENGVRVGVMGANPEDLERLKSEVGVAA